MTGRASLVVLGIAVLAAAAAPAGASVEPAATRKAQLSVVRFSPLEVRGLRFRPYERVTITATVEQTLTRRVTAGRMGRFLVRFGTSTPVCGSLLLRARGAQGSRVVYELPRPDCRGR